MTTVTPTQPEDRTERTDVAEESPFEALPLIRRRRPAGEPQTLASSLGVVGWTWLAVLLAIGATWTIAVASQGLPAWMDPVDASIGRAIVAVRAGWLDVVARFGALLGGVGMIMVLRWGVIVTLIVTNRWRHLFTFVAVVLVMRIGVALLADAIARPRPALAPYLYGWEGYTHPSVRAASLAVSLAGLVYAVIPAGKLRSVAVWASAAMLAFLGLARVYLGVDHPFDVLLGAAAGWGTALFAFRYFCPEDVFPVEYRKGKAAHLEIDEERREAIAEAMDEQTGLELVSIEPFGEETSGGSTPLKIEARRIEGGHVEPLFAKLYSDSHLRADRWYKLARSIQYGALEDERSFSSVRQLVEHEDYMLRLMREGGVPTVEPRGVIELDPEREYLILMTFLARAEEADEDADVDDDVIDAGLQVVRALWDRGLAHRDVKPGNVLIRDGKVYLIDVAFGQLRPSAWRQAVDLANMMLVLALGSSAERVYARATELFTPEEIGEAFAAARGPAIPRQLRQSMKEQDVDLVERFSDLAPEHPPIAVQRWTVWRLALTIRTAVVGGALLALLLINLGDWRSP